MDLVVYLGSFSYSGKVFVVKSCRLFRLCGSAEMPSARFVFRLLAAVGAAPADDTTPVQGIQLTYLIKKLLFSYYCRSFHQIHHFGTPNFKSNSSTMTTLYVINVKKSYLKVVVAKKKIA